MPRTNEAISAQLKKTQAEKDQLSKRVDELQKMVDSVSRRPGESRLHYVGRKTRRLTDFKDQLKVTTFQPKINLLLQYSNTNFRFQHN